MTTSRSPPWKRWPRATLDPFRERRIGTQESADTADLLDIRGDDGYRIVSGLHGRACRVDGDRGVVAAARCAAGGGAGRVDDDDG